MYRENGLTNKSNVESVDERFFENWSHEMAYVLGFFAADGCLTKNSKRQNYYIEFVSTDLDVLKKIKTAMSAGQRITKKVSRVNSGKQGFRIQIGSKKLFQNLLDLGFTSKKSNKVRCPEIPREYYHDFLRGVFDGDGCLTCGNYMRKDCRALRKVISIRFTSGSKIFLEQIINRISEIVGTKGGFIYVKQSSAFELVYSTLDTLKILRYIYQCKNCIYMNRKYKKSMELLASRGLVA